MTDFLGLYKYIAQIAPGSYGILYIHDDEDERGFDNDFRVHALAKGIIEEKADPFLSPFITAVEDSYISGSLLVNNIYGTSVEVKMNYKVKIKEISLCGCGAEGNMLIELGNSLLRVYYQAPDDFIEEYIMHKANYIPKSPLGIMLHDDEALLTIDLWLVYGECKRLNTIEKEYPKSLDVCGGTVKGEIISLSNENDVRIDCGIIIDVDNESNNYILLSKGDYVEVTGTYQVYFPETEFSNE